MFLFVTKTYNAYRNQSFQDKQGTSVHDWKIRERLTFKPAGALCRILHGTLVGFFFCLIPHEPQTAPRCNPKCSCGLCGFLCYVVNGLQYHTPNPYKIAFSSFTIRVRISCSSTMEKNDAGVVRCSWKQVSGTI